MNEKRASRVPSEEKLRGTNPKANTVRPEETKKPKVDNPAN